MDTTSEKFWHIIADCNKIFELKLYDYGISWGLMRRTTLTDQILIKALRIRNIEEKGTQKVTDSIKSEYEGIINYSIIALMHPHLKLNTFSITAEQSLLDQIKQEYHRQCNKIHDLLEAKNHDYGEAWRHMRASSFTDMILTKLQRIRQIEDHQGKTIASEGIDGNYMDIVNYAVFALINIQALPNI